MLYVVTGATGHIGNNVVRMLLKEGAQVRMLLRREQDPAIEGLKAERSIGDLCDLAFLLANITQGCTVLHCAGMIAITEKHADEVYRTNVDITCCIAEACIKQNARLVYVSSVDAIARGGQEVIKEPTHYYPDLLHGCYAKSKALASNYILEQVARNGLNACIVCPSAVVGDHDYKVSCVGQVIDDYIRGLPMARIRGGYNFVSATDVALGILLAAQKGIKGESYLLTGEYMSIEDMFGTLNLLMDKECLPIKLPLWFVRMFAGFGVLYYTVRGKKPVFSRYALQCLNMPCAYNCTATQEKLGYQYRSAAQALTEAYTFFSTYQKA